MRLKFILPYILLIPVLIIQLTVIPVFAFQNIVPDLVLILLIYFTLLNGQLFGTVSGFLFGLIMDLASGGLIGAGMFSKTAAGFITGYFYNDNKVDINTGTLFIGIITFITCFFDSILFGFFSSNVENNTPMLTIIFEQGLLPAIYTTAVSLILIIIPTGRMNYE